MSESPLFFAVPVLLAGRPDRKRGGGATATGTAQLPFPNEQQHKDFLD
jgi:hypothetical protein